MFWNQIINRTFEGLVCDAPCSLPVWDSELKYSQVSISNPSHTCALPTQFTQSHLWLSLTKTLFLFSKIKSRIEADTMAVITEIMIFLFNLVWQIPENSQDGNYTLRVEGSHRDEGRYGFIFENETILLFHPKRVSVFIQTDKAVYQKRETGIVH